jgi:hypothetical protein
MHAQALAVKFPDSGFLGRRRSLPPALNPTGFKAPRQDVSLFEAYTAPSEP